MRYWDSSAILPLLLEETRSNDIRQLVQEDAGIISWWGTSVECFSALWRLKREGVLDERKGLDFKKRLEALFLEADMISPSNLLKNRAIRLLATHSLRAGDALQLAAALRWCQEQTGGVSFVCLDQKLRQAASAEGFTVLP